MRRYLPTLYAAALLAPASVLAQDLDYNHVQGGLALYPSFGNQDMIGIDTRASFLMSENAFAFGGVTRITDDADLTAIHVGGAYRLPLNPGTDLYGGLTIEYQKIRQTFGNTTFSFDDTALGLRGGIRHRVSPQVELAGQLRVITGDLDYVGMRGSAQYFFNGRLSLLGEIDVYDSEVGMIGALRYGF